MTDRFATATGTVPMVDPQTRGERLGRFLRRRARAGWSRVRSSVGQAALVAVCAVGAYWFAEAVLGHQQPLFASTALLIALGFQREPKLRKVAEVAVGCTVGILIGDLLMVGLGRGLWQASVVLFVSVMVARFLDSGATFTMQMSLQSVLVVLLPIGAGGPFVRSQDAIVGGVLALLVTFLSPQDVRRPAVRQLGGLYDSIATVLRDLSRALREDDSRTAWMALVASRGTHTTLEALRKALRPSDDADDPAIPGGFPLAVEDAAPAPSPARRTRRSSRVSGDALSASASLSALASPAGGRMPRSATHADVVAYPQASLARLEALHDARPIARRTRAQTAELESHGSQASDGGDAPATPQPRTRTTRRLRTGGGATPGTPRSARRRSEK